jgi:hypothetical protein
MKKSTMTLIAVLLSALSTQFIQNMNAAEAFTGSATQAVQTASSQALDAEKTATSAAEREKNEYDDETESETEEEETTEETESE